MPPVTRAASKAPGRLESEMNRPSSAGTAKESGLQTRRVPRAARGGFPHRRGRPATHRRRAAVAARFPAAGPRCRAAHRSRPARRAPGWSSHPRCSAADRRASLPHLATRKSPSPVCLRGPRNALPCCSTDSRWQQGTSPGYVARHLMLRSCSTTILFARGHASQAPEVIDHSRVFSFSTAFSALWGFYQPKAPSKSNYSEPQGTSRNRVLHPM
jgi:hypothetical protein